MSSTLRAAFFGVASLIGLAQSPASAQNYQINTMGPASWRTMINPVEGLGGPSFDLQEEHKTPYQAAVGDWTNSQAELQAARTYLDFTKDPANPAKVKAMQDAIQARTGNQIIPHIGEDALREYRSRKGFFLYGTDYAEKYLERMEGYELNARKKVIRMAFENTKAAPATSGALQGHAPAKIGPNGQVQWPDPMKK